MTEQLAVYKKEAQEFNRKKFKELIDENLAFHEWMEDSNRPSFNEQGSKGELTRAELIKLGNDSGIPHPFVCASSPFFCNNTKETLLEIQSPTPEHRPFANFAAITLVNLSDKEKEQPQAHFLPQPSN